MKFTKVVKADENFDQKKFDTIDDATHSFYNGLEGTAYYYKHRGLYYASFRRSKDKNGRCI